MCLGVPGRVVETWEEQGTRMARVDFAGAVSQVCLAYVPDVAVNDYVIAHLGYAISRVDATTAADTVKIMREYGVLEDTA